MTFRKRIKEYLAKKVFKSEYQEVERQKELYQRAREGLSVVDLVREDLRAFNPRALDRADKDLLSEYSSNDELENFLSEVHKLANSKELKNIANYLIRNTIYTAMTEAPDMTHVNFSRATINGIKLVLEEIETYDRVYKESHLVDKDYDKHDIT